MSGSDGGLYEEDFVRWTEQQSTALRDAARAGTNLPHSPSLKGDVAQMIAANSPRVARLTTRVLRLHGEDVGNLAPPMYSEEQVLGDWLPEDSSAPASSP
jgi:hypothetical protein